MWNSILKILAYITDIIPGIRRWWAKRRALKIVNEIEKIVDDYDDAGVVKKLEEIATKIKNRKKIS